MSLQDTLSQIARRLALLEEASMRRASVEVPRARPQAVILYHSVNQSIADNTSTPVVFDSELDDPESWHSTVTNPTRITVAVAGLYLAIGGGSWAANPTGYRQMTIGINGGAVGGPTGPALAGGFGTGEQAMMMRGLASGDYIEMLVAQGSGAPLNLSTPSLAIVRLGSYL